MATDEGPQHNAHEQPKEQVEEEKGRQDGHNGDLQPSSYPSANPSSTLLSSFDAIPMTKDRDAPTTPSPKETSRRSSDSLCRDGQTAAATKEAAQRSPHGGRPPSGITHDTRARPRSFWLRKRVFSTILAAIMFATVVILVVCLAFQATAVCPVVSVSTGKYAGVPLQNGITQWLGIRYAAPPVGDNRFRAPKDPESFPGVRAANKLQPGCAGMNDMPDGTAEDCLFLDVYAPTSAAPDSNLPVFVWIQGGGFASAAGHTNGSALIEASGKNIITVSMTYRAGAFGFLASNEVRDRGDLNNGLRDQRAALRWVQNNIRQFGGDPHHVTVGGQSAGAGSVLQHLVANNGSDEGLFQAALMESQSMPPVRPFNGQQYQYDSLVKRTGCDGNPDTLACLRALDAGEFIKSVVAEPFPGGAGGPPVFSYNPVIDGDFVTDMPAKAFGDGRFIKVPTVFGSTNDEGTIFTPHTLKDAKGATDFFRNNWPALTDAQLDEMSDKYAFDPDKPADPAAPGAYWHRPSVAYGEVRYICAGVYLADTVAKANGGNAWSYRYDVIDPAAIPSGNNCSHGAELPAVWGAPPSGAPKSLFTDNKNIVPVVQGYWTSFIKHFDPSTERDAGAPVWDKFTGKNRIVLTANATQMENVTEAQMGRCEFLKRIAVDITQ